MDWGSRYTEHRLKILDSKLKRVYRQAEKEIQGKLDQFTEKKKKRNDLLLKKLDDGEITEQQYKDWLAGQAFMEKQWKMKQEQVTASLLHANEEALAIVRGEQLNVFAENANHQAYEIEQDFRGAYSFNIYDKKTVENLLTNDPELLPPRKINGRKDRAWNQGIINNCVTQGIIQGESIDKITKRIAKDTASKDMKAMRRYARTAMTSAQNAGRMEMLKRAQGMGIKVQKEWLATLDGKTRDSHRKLDGEVQDISKPFQGEFSEIMFPGDPSAHPAEVYNCRCTLTYVYPDFQKYETDQDWRESEEIDGQSYEEWKEGKKAVSKAPESSSDTQRIQGTQGRYKNSTEYYKAMNERESIRSKEIAEADDWYAKEKDQLLDEYGGSFVKQRVEVRRDSTLTEEEKEKKLAELKAQEKEYNERRAEITDKYYKKLEEANEKYDAVFDPTYEYKKIKGKHSIEEDCGAVNKKYLKEPGNDVNCTKCAVAFEMRQKGYDVIAEPWEGTQAELFRIFPKAERFERTGRGHHNTVAVMGKMKEWGEGSRAIAVIQREVGTGHAFNVMQKDGKFWIVDSQINVVKNNGESGINMYGRALEDLMTTHVSLIRVDNQDAYDIPASFIRRNIND